MLYDYLKEHDGICASHTSATGMGTDWRDTNPTVRADRRDLPGAPPVIRVPGRPAAPGGRASRSAAGSRWGWSGTRWPCSIASASRPPATTSRPTSATPSPSPRTVPARPILDAFRKRHCYAATDNIIMDVRSGEHLMGDEFRSDGPVQLQVRIEGTRPIAAGRHHQGLPLRLLDRAQSPARRVRVDRRRDRPPAGLSWYYVRAIQDDGQLAWASPIWVHLPAVPAATEEP